MRPVTPSVSLVLAVLIAFTATAEIRFDGPQDLLVSTTQTRDAATFAFQVHFTVDDAGDAYFKVVASPQNPAYRTDEEPSAWMHTVHLSGSDGSSQEATGGASDVLQLGPVAPGVSYALNLAVTVSEGSLSKVGDVKPRYLVATSAPAGEGSGGQLDPSLGLNPIITVRDPTLSADDGPIVQLSAWWLAPIGGVVALTGLGIVRSRQGPRGPA